ncbi:MAG: protein-L-isoaspartate O-methyltransferase [Novosphingobium sp.]
MTITEERSASQTDSKLARRAMIDSQLRPSGVNEPWVLDAINAVPREDFVPQGARAFAYTDRAVPLGNGRFLPAPLVHGRMLGEARPTPSDSALIVSASGGYLAALVGSLVGTLEVKDVGDVSKLKKGAYTLILIDGAVEELPGSITAALAEGGRIVGGLVERGVTRFAAGTKIGDSVAWLALAEIGIPVLPEFAAPRRWSF